MIFAGILITLLGFVIGLLSLTMTSNVSVRMTMVLFGIAVSFFGVLGVINRAYLKNANWRK